MIDSIGSQGTHHSASAIHPDHLRRQKRHPATSPVVNVISHPALQTSECVCLACPTRKVGICSALPGSELAALRSISHAAHYKPEAAIFDQDDLAKSVDIVTKGVVRLYRFLPDDRWQVVKFALPGNSLGIAIDDRCDLSATAASDVSICRFSRKAFVDLLETKPHLLRRICEETEHELSSAQDHMMLLSRYSAMQKFAAFLIEMRNRWQRMNSASAYLPLPMPRRDIAAYLGMRYETMSRMMSQLVHQKIVVVVPDGVRILDGCRLAKVAGE